MKRILLISLILLSSSCNDREKNETKYELKWICTKKHFVSSIVFIPCGKIMIPQPKIHTVCDSGHYDTIFKTKIYDNRTNNPNRTAGNIQPASI